MRKLIEIFVLIITIFLVFGCSTKEEIKVQSFGIITENNIDKIVLINPDKYDSFNQLVNRIEKIVCNDSIPTISVKNKYTEKRIGLANPCWEGVACILIKRRNVLKIQDEKIEMSELVEFDSLDEYVSKHYTNNGKSYLFSDNPRKAKITITYKDLPLSGLKPLIIRIIESFEAQNLETPLILTLDRIIPPPPPPPENDEYESNKDKNTHNI